MNTIVNGTSRLVFHMYAKLTLNFYLFCILAFIALSWGFANIDIQNLEGKGSMNASPLSLIDRLPARSTLRGFTFSPCGILGTVVLILVGLWMYVDLVSAYSKGLYFQSSFETQVTAYQNFQSSYDIKMAIVFFNKSSNAIANHTSLLSFFNPKIYTAFAYLNPQYQETVATCDPDYFSDAVNPVPLSSCYTFSPNKTFTYAYQPGTSNPFSIVGFYFTFNCLNPFFCATGGSTLVSVQSNLVALFTNFSATFYFSTRVLQPDGSFKHQVYYISSGQFNSPTTISGQFDAQVVVSNITMDYSIMPWTNIISTSNLGYYGQMKGSTKNTSNIFAPLPRFDTMASNYQNMVFRYYKKEDWMLGVVGGGIFLIHFMLWTICHTFNRGLSQVNAAEELLIEENEAKSEGTKTEEAFKRPSIPITYHLLRFFPCYKNHAIDRVTQMLDITNLLKRVKIVQRNLREKKALKHESKYKRISFDIEVPREQQPFRMRMEEEQPRFGSQRQPEEQDEADRSDLHRPLDQSNSNLFPQLDHQDSLPFQNKPSDFEPMKEEKLQEMKIEVEKEEEKVEQKAQERKRSNPPRQREKIDENLLQSHEKMMKEDNEENDLEFQQVSFNPFDAGPPKQQSRVEKSIRSSQEENKNQPLEKVQEKAQEKAQENRSQKKSENKEQQPRLRSSDKSSGQKMEMKSLQIKDQMKISQNQENRPIVMQNQQEIQPQRNEDQINQRLSDLLGIHPQAIKALKNSQNTKDLFSNFLTIMHLTNNQEEVNEIRENQEYDEQPYQPPKSRFIAFRDRLVYCFRLLDFYGVKVQFNADSANHSLVGIFFTLIIIALPILQLFNLLQLAGTNQVIVSRDFLQPSQIDYNLVTGAGQSFRPAACFSPTAYSQLKGAGQTVQLIFYTYSAAQGYNFYNPVNLDYNQYQTLGISPDSIYSRIDTSLCFIFPDGTPIPMGGYNTPKQAYFGFRVRTYCTGTVQYCESTAAADNAKFFSFINIGQGSFTFYSPVNQYSPSKNSVYTGQMFANPLREGTSGFSTNSSIQETVYLDRIQLLDSYKAKFVGAPPQVIQETICTSRYQVGEVTKSFNSSSPYYQLRVRPSGTLTKVILTGYTLPMILGLIGGVYFLCWAVFHLFGKCYNGYNQRMKLALQIYDQDAYNHPFIHKSCYFLSSYFCCKKCKYASTRMKLLNSKIKEDLNALEVVKTVYSLSKLSSVYYNSAIEKDLVGVYFKERANDLFKVKKDKKEKVEEESFMEDLQDWDEEIHNSNNPAGPNQVANESVSEKSGSRPANQGEQQDDSQEEMEDELDKEYRLQKIRDEVDFLQPREKYKKNDNLQRAGWREFFSNFDFFHSDAQFSLNGQWRVRSICGCLFTLLTIALIFCIYLYFLVLYDTKSNYLISYDRSMLADPDNTPPLQLNATNFRLAVGFYRKPDFAFVNVQQYINSTVNSVIAVSVFLYKQTWINSRLVNSETIVDMIPCPANYFDNFMSPNEDPSYYTSVTNGFCLPSDLSLNLTSNIFNNSQFFKVSVHNKTAAASTLLQTLTTSFPLGVYMSIPIVNLQGQNFAYEVQQIRPNSQTLLRAYEVNVTLTRQKMVFHNPDYTLNQIKTTQLETYEYLQNRGYERVVNVVSSAARAYNITFCHSGLRETYTVTYPSIAELFGFAGGIILVLIFVVGCIPQSFNTYYKEYLIGRTLYLYWTTKNKKKKKNKERLEQEDNENEQQHQAFLERQEKNYFEKVNDFSQASVILAWLLSFPAAIINSYEWNDTLSKVHKLRQQARSDLDLFNFYKQLVQLKDTINSNPNNRLSANRDIPITAIYDKKLIMKAGKYQYPTTDRYFKDVKYHEMSSREQWILSKAERREILLGEVFSREYRRNVFLSQNVPREREEERMDRHEEMVLERQSRQSRHQRQSRQSRKSRPNRQVQPQEWINVPHQTPQIQVQPQLPTPAAESNIRQSQNPFQFNINGQQQYQQQQPSSQYD